MFPPGYNGSKDVAVYCRSSDREEDGEAAVVVSESLEVRDLLGRELHSAVRVHLHILVEEVAAGTRVQLVGALLALEVAEHLLPCLC